MFRLRTPLGVASACLLATAKGDNGLRAPQVVELGAKPTGALAVAVIKIANAGDVPASLGRFAASCSCMMVYRREGAAKLAIDTLTIPPHSESEVCVDVRISGDHGLPQATSLSYQDLASGGRYATAIVFIPVARLYAVPKAISFGDILVGTGQTRRVEIRSDGGDGNDGVSATPSDARLLGAAFTPAAAPDRSAFASEYPGQNLVGYLDVQLNPLGTPARLSAIVTVGKPGLDSLQVPVNAEIRPSQSLVPDRLMLPRQSSGTPVYSASVLCRSRSGARFVVEPVATGAPFRVTTNQPTEERPGSAQILVEYTGPTPGAKPVRHELSFRVIDQGRESLMTLPITIAPASP